MSAASSPSGSTQGHPPMWPLYRAMVGVGLLCGLLIVVVFEVTRPVIARNRVLALERGILEVLTSMKRAGADIILTYHAREAARLLG